MSAPPRPGLARHGSSIASQNKTIVLVTGGNAGIGYEIVKSLSSLRTDYQILLGARDIRKGEAAASSMGAPINVNPIQLDITDDNSVEHCFKAIEQHFGRLDILINNAGTAGNDVGPSATLREKWSHVYDVNVVSAGVVTEKLIPLLEHSKAPKIIFITSDLGSMGNVLKNGKSAAPQVPFYSASKTAVNMLTLQYATQYPNFRINACCPGLRATGLHGENPIAETDETAAALGAVNAVRLATEVDGPTGTYTNSEGPIPW